MSQAHLPPPPPPMDLFNANSWIRFTDYHDLPRNPDKLCPKFQIHSDAEEHLRIFKDMCGRARIQHEDVVCILFPYTLSNKSYV